NLWNDTDAAYPRDLCIHQVFEQQAARTPDAEAVVYEGETLTYGELNRRANQLAHYLRRLGVGRETLVGISVERSLEMMVGVLGILKAGGTYVPIDPSYPTDRIVYMLEDAGMPILVTQERLVSQLPPHDARVVRLDADWPEIGRESEANPEPWATPDNLAYCIYTSGSMGRPKGVMLPHSGLVNAYYAWESSYQLRQVKSHLQMASLSFDVFTGDWTRALCSGGKLVLCPRDLLLQPDKLYALMQQERVDCAEFVPVVLRSLAQHLDKTGANLDFMRLVLCGSDSWYVGEYREFLRLCGPQTRLINSFGLTEATIDSCYYETRELDGQADRLVPIGRPFANNRLYILDERLQPLPVGVPGESYVGGAGLARGYFHRPDLTAERFVPDPFGEPGARLYRTGDLARFLGDGNIEFLGRADNQVKIRGFRVELGEIEAVLGQHPALADVAVTVAEDRPGNPRLVAYLVAADGQTPSAGELRRFLQERLPDYMVPSAYVPLDALPVTPNGKVDRKALPAPDWSQRDVASAYVAPRTETEARLAQVWAQVLGVEQVGV
ncbi:MAG: amino acid adenylation domain-containing protein, partial [Chloroflexi bacterium]|nr:amino acid adenylation domain-containing protein [Chloroflexota bacterium]